MSYLEVNGFSAVGSKVSFSQSFRTGLQKRNGKLRDVRLVRKTNEYTHRMGMAHSGNIFSSGAIFHGQDSFIDQFSYTLSKKKFKL